MVVTVIPVIIGMLLRAKWHNLAQRSERFVSWFSIFVLVFVILSIAITQGEKWIGFIVLTGPAAILLNLSTMLLGYFAGRYLLHQESQSRAITLEVGLQNSTLTLLITQGILQSSEMSVAPSVYSIFMFMSASVFTYYVLKKDKTTKQAAI